MLLVLLLLLPLAIADDVLRDHLEHLVDYSVNPCDDFYSHVCKKERANHKFIAEKLPILFTQISAKFRDNGTLHNEILIDFEKTKLVNRNSIKTLNYEQFARQRCGDDLGCYHADRLYYLKKKYSMNGQEIDEVVKFKDDPSDLHSQIDNTIAETTKYINETLPNFFKFATSRVLDFVNPDIKVYGLIVSRIQMIEFLQSNSTFSDLHDIKEFTNRMKESMLEKINSTTWLHQDVISRAVLDVMLKRVSDIGVYHDYDHIDRNLTTLRGLEKDFRKHYNSNERKTGFGELDICFRFLDASEMIKANLTDEMKVYFYRIEGNFLDGAFYTPENAITILAPFLFKKMVSSELLSEPLLTYGVIAHELFHSLFTTATSTLIDVYGKRGQCLMDHYSKSCSLYGKHVCESRNITIYEDGADAEGLRLLYDMFAKDHSGNLDKPTGFRDLTKIQAFFYYTSIYHCKDSSYEHPSGDRHSSGNTRVNAVVSLMPEFSRAFGCKNGDRMFTEERTCQIFGRDA